MRERVDLGDLAEIRVNLPGAGQGVPPVDVHGAGATDACKRQGTGLERGAHLGRHPPELGVFLPPSDT